MGNFGHFLKNHFNYSFSSLYCKLTVLNFLLKENCLNVMEGSIYLEQADLWALEDPLSCPLTGSRPLPRHLQELLLLLPYGYSLCLEFSLSFLYTPHWLTPEIIQWAILTDEVPVRDTWSRRQCQTSIVTLFPKIEKLRFRHPFNIKLVTECHGHPTKGNKWWLDLVRSNYQERKQNKFFKLFGIQLQNIKTTIEPKVRRKLLKVS